MPCILAFIWVQSRIGIHRTQIADGRSHAGDVNRVLPNSLQYLFRSPNLFEYLRPWPERWGTFDIEALSRKDHGPAVPRNAFKLCRNPALANTSLTRK